MTRLGGVWGLVVPAVFNTDVAEDLGQAGSIPVRLRHLLRRPEGSPQRSITPPPGG